jgi:hypothetical protein
MSDTEGRTEGGRSLRYVYPLRPDFVVTLDLPRDLTKSEAERMGAMLRTLSLTDEEQADG